MKKRNSAFLAILLALSLLAGCGGQGAPAGDVSGGTAEETHGPDTEASQVPTPETAAEMFTRRDCTTEYDEQTAVTIRLNGTAAEASSDSVRIQGSVITLTEAAAYLISGSLTDGMLVVDAPDSAKLHLILNGADITCSDSAALYIRAADKVVVTLAEGTENTLANGGSFTQEGEDRVDGAVFSKQDLTLNGSGSLTVTSPAGHGIVCKDDLVLTGGTYRVNSASHALDANDSVRIMAAELNLRAGKDAIHCENTEDASLGFIYIAGGSISAEAEGDGFSAGAYLNIEGGTFDLLTGGGSENGTRASSGNYGGFMGGAPGAHGGMRPGSGSAPAAEEEDAVSMKGLKAEELLLISGGVFRIDSADDSIHSNGSIVISGGSFELSSGDDAVHGEDTLTVTAGEINVSESYEGLEALHVAVEGGSIRIVADDDGLNAAGGTDGSGTGGGRDGMFGGGKGAMGGGMSAGNGSIVISGGDLYIEASGDGIDANGTVEISGGYTVVAGPIRGDTATLDYDRSAVITGGTFIGTGASGMAQTFSDSGQGVIALSVGEQAAGTAIILKDRNGSTLVEYSPKLPFAVVILSSPRLVTGEVYSITVGAASGEFEAR